MILDKGIIKELAEELKSISEEQIEEIITAYIYKLLENKSSPEEESMTPDKEIIDELAGEFKLPKKKKIEEIIAVYIRKLQEMEIAPKGIE